MAQVSPCKAVIMSKANLFWMKAFLRDISVFSKDRLGRLSFKAYHLTKFLERITEILDGKKRAPSIICYPLETHCYLQELSTIIHGDSHHRGSRAETLDGQTYPPSQASKLPSATGSTKKHLLGND